MIELNEEAHENEEPTVKVPEVRLGKGKIVTTVLTNRQDAIAVAQALEKPGILDVLAVIGRIENLQPAERKLAQTLMGE